MGYDPDGGDVLLVNSGLIPLEMVHSRRPNDADIMTRNQKLKYARAVC